jgi:hypothetical protein
MQKESTPLPDINERIGPAEPDFGVRVSGARITSVIAGSNADSFGLVAGDVIAKINGRVVPSAMDATDLIDLIDAGTPVTLTVTRATQTLELKGTYNPTSMPRRIPFFNHSRPSGRIDLKREGNTVTAVTRRVAAFTLLVSPDQFDLDKPIKVIADGRTVFEGVVKPSVATLLKWAARDNDRTMLFAAEVPVRLGN